MKAFRGSMIAAALLLAALVLVWWVKPAVFEPTIVEGSNIFSFEKHELVRVAVERPGDESIVLLEAEGQWIIEQTGHVAGRSMVNRVKHQLHDLTARASVVEDTENLSLYGLGQNAIHAMR